MASATSSSCASPEQATVTSDQPTNKSFSCVLCAQRKVKCDKRPGGCHNCIKARVPCIYKAPPPPRRRRKGIRDLDVTTKLRIYENALRKAGIDPESLLQQTSPSGPCDEDDTGASGKIPTGYLAQPAKQTGSPDVGVLVIDQGKSRYLENGIWTSLRSEFRDLKEILDDTSDDDSLNGATGMTSDAISQDVSKLMFGSPVSSLDLRPLHPRPVESFKLWQAYLDNVNPLIKLFHAPTVQQIISEASGSLDEIPRNVEALLFAIYCIAIESLSNGECTIVTGESKIMAKQRFRTGAQRALINASFLKTSDLMVLQALTLFVLSLQDVDARIIWMLSGMCQRIGQRIGLHRDGDMLKLPPFEAEIRRRLWWQIVMLEGFSQKLAGTGTGTNASTLMGDVRLPANLNDSDLFPGMKELPKETDRATEMMFFLIRCHVGNFLKRFETTQTQFDGVWSKLTTSTVDVNKKDRAIRELEDLFDRKFLRYCDPSIVWHLMCSHLAKAIIFMMRFMAYGADYQGKTETQAEKDTLFTLSLQVLTSMTLAYTMREMQGFVWHVNMHFQWKALVFILSELRYRTSGPQVEQAWQQIQLTYEFHPTFDEEVSRRALPIAVSNLALKAWEAYRTANGLSMDGEPFFIQLIRNRQQRVEKPSMLGQQPNTSVAGYTPTDLPEPIQRPSADVSVNASSQGDLDWNRADLNASLGLQDVIPDLALFDYPVEMNWSSWNELLIDSKTNNTDIYRAGLSQLDFGV
ncbi:hypothetical protein B5807_00025 [Epicoccum nigrum]|uniref:Zn(2)-C6 fungal-type domain-containing protein n=1 Tax=Epicoccum nigrum TaxID=105696 RepID=A0A1Y2MDS6_EPING|nr:hypothetical protein B5807_00025 [Epicoccum nigrum]